MNKIDQRSIIAVVLCVMFYLAYTNYLNTKYPKVPHTDVAVQTGTPGAAAPTTTSPTATAAQPAAVSVAAGGTPIVQLSNDDLRIENDKVTYQFSQDLGGFAALDLHDYRSSIEKGAGPVDLLDSPMAVQATTDLKTMDPVHGVFHAERHNQSIRFWRDLGDFRLTQEFTIPATGYSSELKVSFTNISGKDTELTGGLLVTESIRPKKAPMVLGLIPGSNRVRDQLVYNADGSTDWLDIEKLCKDDKDPPKYETTTIRYFGIDRHYFMTAFQPKAATGSLRTGHGGSSSAGCALSFLNFDKQGTVKAGETISLDFLTYTGPKDLQVLQAYDPELGSSMHLGTFGFIAKPLLVVIEGFEKVVHNYGLAIILLTICLKILFFPLVRASAISMHKMKKLNPQMALIKEKFKDDKAKQQQALMKFMGENKVNPMKGCLPVLPQIPVFFAFYQVLQTSIHLRHAPFALWIQDLSAMDPYFVTPLLMGVAMFLQQKLTPTNGMDKTQEKILMLMPIMFTVMMLTLPAGLTLYMLTNTAIGIIQQKWLYRRLDRLEPSMR